MQFTNEPNTGPLLVMATNPTVLNEVTQEESANQQDTSSLAEMAAPGVHTQQHTQLQSMPPSSSSISTNNHSRANPTGPVNVASRWSFRVEDGLNLYVSQIPPTYNSTKLRDVFVPFGAVHSAKVIHDPTTNESRCFGFVLFEKASEGERAMSEMNGVVLEPGRSGLHVRVARASALPQALKDDGSVSSAASNSSTPVQRSTYDSASGTPPIMTHTSTPYSGSSTTQQQQQQMTTTAIHLPSAAEHSWSLFASHHHRQHHHNAPQYHHLHHYHPHPTTTAMIPQHHSSPGSSDSTSTTTTPTYMTLTSPTMSMGTTTHSPVGMTVAGGAPWSIPQQMISQQQQQQHGAHHHHHNHHAKFFHSAAASPGPTTTFTFAPQSHHGTQLVHFSNTIPANAMQLASSHTFFADASHQTPQAHSYAPQFFMQPMGTTPSAAGHVVFQQHHHHTTVPSMMVTATTHAQTPTQQTLYAPLHQ